MSNRNSHQSTGGQQHSLVVANNEAPNSVISSFIRAHIESSPDPNHLDYSQVFSYFLLKEFRLQMNKTWSEHDPTHSLSNFLQYTTGSDDFDTKDSLLPSSSSGDDPNTNTSARVIAQFYGLLTSSIEGNIKTFCMQIPNIFSERISPEDLDLLFQNSCLELFMLRVAYR